MTTKKELLARIEALEVRVKDLEAEQQPKPVILPSSPLTLCPFCGFAGGHHPCSEARCMMCGVVGPHRCYGATITCNAVSS